MVFLKDFFVLQNGLENKENRGRVANEKWQIEGF